MSEQRLKELHQNLALAIQYDVQYDGTIEEIKRYCREIEKLEAGGSRIDWRPISEPPCVGILKLLALETNTSVAYAYEYITGYYSTMDKGIYLTKTGNRIKDKIVAWAPLPNEPPEFKTDPLTEVVIRVCKAADEAVLKERERKVREILETYFEQERKKYGGE